MRMMAVFEKGERLRHIGHLDIMRSTQRALRRSGLPVSYSKGFNPHILISCFSSSMKPITRLSLRFVHSSIVPRVSR